MPAEINMPQLSDTMTEGTVVKWLKKEGDKVKAGEIIAEVETDKATMEMESFEGGTLAVVLAKEGNKTPVGKPIAVLATGKETVDEVKKKYAGGAAASAAAPSPATGATPTVAKPDEESGESARGEHAVRGSPATALQAGEPRSTAYAGGATATANVAADKPEALGNGSSGRQFASPLAKRIAEDKGVDLKQVQGSGPGGRIVQADVLAFIEKGPSTPAAPAAAPAEKKAPAVELPQRIGSGERQVVPLTKMRQTIALRLQQSKQQLPHFYESIDIDCEAMVALREKLNKQLEPQKVRVSVSDFVNKAIAAALKQHPGLNAHWDDKNQQIIRFGDVHLGIAVSVPDGLIVPVLKSIDQMGLKEIRQRSVDLADRARAGKLKGQEMTGATFTVSTLGAYGIKEFNAIINPPEVGILAVGAAEKRAVVVNDQIVARTVMTVTLSVDHRAVDGATAAEFLRTLKHLIEEPGLMLV
jgi:pyruvate dehydrogenase E2 component (dihydrolipoamide acetyltransferase)